MRSRNLAFSETQHQFHFQLWFLTHESDGLLLYNGQNSNGDGDFVSLNLVSGRVHFTYDLGSGSVTLRSDGVAAPGRWHRVRAARTGREGTLRLDSGKVVRGAAVGALTELNLELPLYLGGFR